MPIETNIKNTILKYLNSLPKTWAYKTHGGRFSRTGLPDIVCCLNGHFFAFEVKRPDGGETTKLQDFTLRKISEAGGKSYVVTSVKQVREIVKKVVNQ